LKKKVGRRAEGTSEEAEGRERGGRGARPFLSKRFLPPKRRRSAGETAVSSLAEIPRGFPASQMVS